MFAACFTVEFGNTVVREIRIKEFLKNRIYISKFVWNLVSMEEGEHNMEMLFSMYYK